MFAPQEEVSGGDKSRVVLLQLHLGIRTPTQGIFQYNNVLGLDLNAQWLQTGEAVHPIQALENQVMLPGTGQYRCMPYFYSIYMKSAELRSFQTSDGQKINT
jgi:hypothetical protein